jgi:hypothetical protein
MKASERCDVARWGNCETYKIYKYYRASGELMKQKFAGYDQNKVNSLVMWAASPLVGDLSKVSDEELKKMISIHFGYADDEQLDPSKIIITPDALVVGTNYALATNGYHIGKYLGSRMGPSHPGKICGCDGTQMLFFFENGNRDYTVFDIGLVAV